MDRETLLANYDALYDPEGAHTQHASDLLTEKVIRPRLRGRAFAELGISTGIMSVRLAPHCDRYLLVDANPKYCAHVKRRLAGAACRVEVIETFFDALDPARLRDTSDVFLISMVHVLPGVWPSLLELIAEAVAPGARVHLTLSNRLAPNRLVGYHMGLIESLDAVDEQARAFDTHYVDAEDVERVAAAAGLETVAHEGFLCRPVPLSVLNTFVDRAGVELLWRMGQSLPPRFCNTTYLCLERAE
ncbi:MAG: class I SAM-dependent methyltransferase [Myxococcales bacterium]|nr:class I SAM-dependent methyltransferase [Myxococcales bacterium]